MGRARLSGQPRHPGKVGDAQSLLGDRGPPRALPQRGLRGEREHTLRESEGNRWQPRQQGRSHTRPPAGEDGCALPGRGARGLMSPGASHPGLERAIKCSGARHGIRAIFPSRGRSRIFFWGGGGAGVGGKKKERKRRKDLPQCCLLSLPLSGPQARPGDTQGSPRRRPAQRTSWLALSVSGSVRPCPGRALWAFTCLSAKWTQGPQTSKRGPFQLCSSTSLDLSRAGAGFQWSC